MIHMSVWEKPRPAEPSYVLVADGDGQRTAACLDSIRPFNVRVLVAPDGEEAIGILERVGPPVLLVTDLSLAGRDGFAIVTALRAMDRGRAEIIAWSSSREQRELARHRLGGLNVRVLGGTVAPAVVRGAIERALRHGASADGPPGQTVASTAEDVYQTVAELSEKAQLLCGTAGVAVYLRASEDTQFRASVTWTSDAPIPHSPSFMPRVFSRILETGEVLVLPDVRMAPAPDIPSSTLQDVRGLVAVPIFSTDEQVVGTICVFDIKPLTLGGDEIEQLKGLGRGLPVRAAIAARPALEDEPIDPAEAKTEPDESVEPAPGDLQTPLLDRRGGDLAIARELARVRREQGQLSVIMFEADACRHTNGDLSEQTLDPLSTVGETLTRAIRGSDLAIRWSRGELLVVLPGISASDARHVAERVRAAMHAGSGHRVAVSGGVAELLAHETFDAVVARANEKLRLARERGHNRVA